MCLIHKVFLISRCIYQTRKKGMKPRPPARFIPSHTHDPDNKKRISYTIASKMPIPHIILLLLLLLHLHIKYMLAFVRINSLLLHQLEFTLDVLDCWWWVTSKKRRSFSFWVHATLQPSSVVCIKTRYQL